MKNVLVYVVLIALLVGAGFIVGSCESKEVSALKKEYDYYASYVPDDVIDMAETYGNELGWRVNNDELTSAQYYYYCIGFMQGYRYFFDR